MQYIASLFKIAFILTYELHSLTFADIKSKVHIHNLNESHNTIQVCRPPIAIAPGEKGVNRGVEQPHAQWIISNLKTKPVHSISQLTGSRYSYHHVCIGIYVIYSHLTQRVLTLARNYVKYIKISQVSNILHRG